MVSSYEPSEESSIVENFDSVLDPDPDPVPSSLEHDVSVLRGAKSLSNIDASGSLPILFKIK